MSEVAKITDLWPVLLVEAPPKQTLESVEWFCARMDEVFARRERFATVFDMRGTSVMLDAKARKSMGDWMKDRDVDLKRWVVAAATVTDSALVRGVITAIHWIWKPSSPEIVTGDVREGFDFVIGELRKKGVPISAKLESYKRSVA